MIYQPLSPDGFCPPNQFVPEIVIPLLCSSGLVHHTLLFVYFFQRTHFFHWLRWHMPHQNFQCFDFLLYDRAWLCERSDLKIINVLSQATQSVLGLDTTLEQGVVGSIPYSTNFFSGIDYIDCVRIHSSLIALFRRWLCGKAAGLICKKCRLRSACAVRAGWPVPRLFALVIFLHYERQYYLIMHLVVKLKVECVLHSGPTVHCVSTKITHRMHYEAW